MAKRKWDYRRLKQKAIFWFARLKLMQRTGLHMTDFEKSMMSELEDALPNTVIPNMQFKWAIAKEGKVHICPNKWDEGAAWCDHNIKLHGDEVNLEDIRHLHASKMVCEKCATYAYKWSLIP